MSSSDALSDAEHLTETERRCLDLCDQAVAVSEWCVDQSLEAGGETSDCRRLCRDVADVASLQARLLARGSRHREAMAGICATICENAAGECEQHDEEHWEQCVEILSECAGACESMAA